MIKTIIFDYAGVITPTRDKIKFAEKNSESFNMTQQDLLDVLYKNWDSAAINQMSSSEYWNQIGLDLSMDPKKIKKMVMHAFPIEPRIVSLIDNLQDKFTLVMLSNQIEDWLEEVIDQNNLRNKFNYFANSYQLGISKPDSKIFLAALEKAGSKPNETLFIDDSLKNIEAAKKLGINTIKFENYEQFIKEFEEFVSF